MAVATAHMASGLKPGSHPPWRLVARLAAPEGIPDAQKRRTASTAPWFQRRCGTCETCLSIKPSTSLAAAAGRSTYHGLYPVFHHGVLKPLVIVHDNLLPAREEFHAQFWPATLSPGSPGRPFGWPRTRTSWPARGHYHLSDRDATNPAAGCDSRVRRPVHLLRLGKVASATTRC